VAVSPTMGVRGFSINNQNGQRRGSPKGKKVISRK
jgi:hypothetical protein